MAFIQDYNINTPGTPSPSGYDTAVHLSQYENGRKLYFRILGVDIPAGSSATISGTKPDGNVYSKAGTIDGEYVVVEEDVQMTAVAGRWYAKIHITNGDNTIATTNIVLNIYTDPVEQGAIPSDTQLDGIVVQCQAYAEAARSSAYGSPLTASTAAAMTDQTRVYVYTGSETGYTAGHWYYYDGSAWTDGGAYNSAAVQTDKTLAIPGMAADSKAVGDAIAAEAAARAADIDDVKEDLKAIGVGELPLNIVKGQYVKTDGGFANDGSWSRSEYIYVGDATDLEIVSSAHSAYNVFYDSAFQKINNFVVESGSNNITLPDNTEYIALSNVTAAMDATTVRVSAYKVGKIIADIQSDIVDIQDEISGNLRFDLIANSYVETSGSFASYNGWSRTDYIDVGGYAKLITTGIANSPYNVFYDANKAKINNFSIPVGTAEIVIPSGTKYIAMSNETAAMKSLKVKYVTAYDNVLQKVPHNLMIGEGVAEKVKGYLISEMSNAYVNNGAVITTNRYVGLTACHKLDIPIDISFGDLSFKVNYYYTDDIADISGQTSWNTNVKRIPANCYFTIHAQQSTALSLEEAYNKLSISVPDIVSLRANCQIPNLTYSTQYNNPSRFQLLWFSDIHADTSRLKRIMQYANAHSNEISDVICTGDMVADKVTDDYTFWDTAGAGDVLTIIGNHDGNTGSGWATNKTMFDKFFAPYIANWNVEYTANYCNWYKVYNSSIMLIGLCAVNSTTAEYDEMMAFLNNALSVAKTNNYAVVIAHHYPSNPAKTTKYNTAFETIGFVAEDLFIPEAVFTAVKDFNDDGGEFVCYMTGHTHADLARYRTVEKQIVLTISTAFTNAGIQQYAQYREYDTKYEDLFNIFYVDRNTKTVAIKRIGSDRDVWFRKLDYLAINYQTGEMT